VADFAFGLKKFLTWLVLPPVGPVLLSMIGLALIARRPRLGRALAWGGLALLVALAMPIVAYGLLASLESGEPLALERAREADAIVVIAGGLRRGAREYGGDTLNGLTLDRVRYGAWVARRTRLPILVSGGIGRDGAREADLMRRALEEEFGVKVRWVENQSRDTSGNARLSADLLRAAGVRRIVLVTHGVDMRRAGDAFRAAGLEVIAAPTGLARPPGDAWRDWLPGIGALVGSYYALYEHLALAARRMRLD